MWLLFLRQNLKPILYILYSASLFLAGYNLRATQEKLKAYKNTEKANIEANRISAGYEIETARISEKYETINTGVTYEASYNCTIPADGLRILAEATR